MPEASERPDNFGEINVPFITKDRLSQTTSECNVKDVKTLKECLGKQYGDDQDFNIYALDIDGAGYDESRGPCLLVIPSTYEEDLITQYQGHDNTINGYSRLTSDAQLDKLFVYKGGSTPDSLNPTLGELSALRVMFGISTELKDWQASGSQLFVAYSE